MLLEFKTFHVINDNVLAVFYYLEDSSRVVYHNRIEEIFIDTLSFRTLTGLKLVKMDHIK